MSTINKIVEIDPGLSELIIAPHLLRLACRRTNCQVSCGNTELTPTYTPAQLVDGFLLKEVVARPKNPNLICATCQMPDFTKN
ncbi:MAG TPA: hypothetical protein VN174_02450 [Candidatus Methanoperedens sp.]|nr:hypothetical protein [Candidatus Methanoperedens sp.]